MSDRLTEFVLGVAVELVCVGEQEVDRDADERVVGDALGVIGAITRATPSQLGQRVSLIGSHTGFLAHQSPVLRDSGTRRLCDFRSL
ncbi:hypothetical protein [Saccharopolyspora rhizosphaerae]|uniref:hypothetical protein n=1 Tax=Saccharopolyspora rhizosphaerae TaxID=2492662 RepID=UPI0013154149|nr:hypothetical protein [Saccharopolyspora rhizosphaerae]